MVHRVIYWLRGWVAFVAFLEFSNSLRSIFDDRQFLQKNILAEGEIILSQQSLCRMSARYYLLNGVILTHCALFIHHMPIISLTICTLILSIALYLSEVFYYYTMLLDFYVIFPTVISLFTIVTLFIAPLFIEDEPKRKRLNYYEESDEDEDEDFETNVIKKQTNSRKMNYTTSSSKIKTQ